MAGEMTLQAMQGLDPVGAMRNAQGMAINKLNLQDAQMKQQRTQDLEGIRQQASSSNYDIEGHKQLLMDNGFFEEALDLDELQSRRKKSQMDITKSGLEILNKTAQMTSAIGAPGWQALRGALINTGMATEDSLPTEYDEQAQKIATGLVGNTDKILKVLKFRSGNQARDILTQGGKVVEVGEPYSKGADGKDNRGAFEKQVEADSRVLMDKFPWLNEKDARFMAREQFFTSKEKSDLAVAQRAREIAYRATYGSEEETEKFVQETLRMQEAMKQERIPAPPPTPSQSSSAGAEGSAGGPGAQQEQIPVAARQYLKEGQETTFKNGQVWTLQNGQPVRVR